MSNKLKEIIYEIQYKQNLTLEEIAKKIGYAPTYLSKAMNKGVEGKLLAALLSEFSGILDKAKPKVSLSDKAQVYDALLSILATEVAALKSDRTGEPVQSIIRKIYKAAEDEMKRLD